MSSVDASEFYAILVGDTSEKTIASVVKSDIVKMKEEVRRIAKYTGLRLKLVVLQGNRLTLDNLQLVFDQLNPSSDDTVLFYQSSHGFRTKEKKGRWPILYFHSSNTGIYFESINELLQSKKSRLLISIVNACNAKLPKDFFHSEYPLDVIYRSKESSENRLGIYKKLFVHAKGVVIASSSKPRQQSFGIDQEGSFFTVSFLEALKKTVSGFLEPDWEKVMQEVVDETKKRAKNYDCTQQPQFISNTI